MQIKESTIAGKTMRLETGRVARQSNGSVLVTYGETTIHAAVNAAPGPFTWKYVIDKDGLICGCFFSCSCFHFLKIDCVSSFEEVSVIVNYHLLQTLF